MKANQRFVAEEEAVSPVIAVILMVAITVVLAATVFVLVNDLGKNVGSTGPSLGLVSDSATSSTSQWTIKVSSATKLADLTDYRFVLTTPANGTIVALADDNTFTTANQECALAPEADATRKETTTCAGSNAADLRFTWTDIDGNSKWSVGDTLKIDYDDEDADATFGDTMSTGEHTIELLHIPSGSSSASLPRTF